MKASYRCSYVFIQKPRLGDGWHSHSRPPNDRSAIKLAFEKPRGPYSRTSPKPVGRRALEGTGNSSDDSAVAIAKPAWTTNIRRLRYSMIDERIK